MAGYWPRFFFRGFIDLDSVSVYKHAKKELGQYPGILTSHLVNNPYSQFRKKVIWEWVVRLQIISLLFFEKANTLSSLK